MAKRRCASVSASRMASSVGWPCCARVESVEPDIEFLAAFGKAERGVVRNVIATPHERVDRAQCLALAARQNEKGVVEILGRRRA